MEDIGSNVHVWRVNAQDELVRRGSAVREELLGALRSGKITETRATWAAWALGHIDKADGDDHADLKKFALGDDDLNLRIQTTRILGENEVSEAVPLLTGLLAGDEPRIRAAAMGPIDRIGWGEHGVAIGPDLVGIAKRRDISHGIQSTLAPDAYIVEGFQQTSLEMKDGRVLFGMVGEETALAVKLVLPTGEQMMAKADDVKKRSDAKNSSMPASFAYTLSAQDATGVSAWIMGLK